MARARGLAYVDRLASQGRTAFNAADAQRELGLSPAATSNALRRLVDAGLVDRIAAGRYAIRPIGALGTGAAWDDLGSAVAAAFTNHPHRIGFLTALDQHGLLVRPVRTVQVASPYRPRLTSLSGRPLQVVRESPAFVLVGTEPLGPARMSTVERALLDTGARPKLTGGASRLAEALAAARGLSGLRELAERVDALAAFRRIGSIAAALSLQVAGGLAPLPWESPIDLDPTATRERGWVDTVWGVAWPYPTSRLKAEVAG